MNNLFNWNDYLELNKDLTSLKTKEEAENHWCNVGNKRMRLCNKKQLEVINEFGNEIIIYLPYYYYLYCNNLLFDNKIITYKGMRPFYYFMKEENILEKEETRHWTHYDSRPLLVNNNEHVKNFDKKYWYPLPYKEIYKNNILLFEKPLLIIHNKYGVEWDIKPINYISVHALRQLFDELYLNFTIVYIRPSSNYYNKGYSLDSNLIQDFDDYDLINNEYKDKLLTMNDLLNKYSDYNYNQLLLMLYSNCSNYISVQGGSNYLISYFFKNIIILHKQGGELGAGTYDDDGWIKDANNEVNKNIIICDNDMDILKNLNIFMKNTNSEKHENENPFIRVLNEIKMFTKFGKIGNNRYFIKRKDKL